MTEIFGTFFKFHKNFNPMQQPWAPFIKGTFNWSFAKKWSATKPSSNHQPSRLGILILSMYRLKSKPSPRSQLGPCQPKAASPTFWLKDDFAFADLHMFGTFRHSGWSQTISALAVQEAFIFEVDEKFCKTRTFNDHLGLPQHAKFSVLNYILFIEILQEFRMLRINNCVSQFCGFMHAKRTKYMYMYRRTCIYALTCTIHIHTNHMNLYTGVYMYV